MGGSRQEILHWQQDMNRREFKERMAFLKGHLAKFRAERTELAKACVAAGGHDWTSTPNNELNAEPFATDDPPMWCSWCGTHQKPWWMGE